LGYDLRMPLTLPLSRPQDDATLLRLKETSLRFSAQCSNLAKRQSLVS